MRTHKKITRGFTLVELMVVISVISLLSSVSMYSTAQARVKAEDARKKSQIHQVETAIAIKKTATGKTPRNYSCAGVYCAGGTGSDMAAEGTQAYNASMQELVSGGYLAAIPDSKDDSYVYYATPTADSAAFGAELQSTSATASSRSYCSSVPLPYSSCVNTMSTGTYTPAEPSEGTVVFREGTGEAYQFCKIYGLPSTAQCFAQGGNGQFENACYGVTPASLGDSGQNLPVTDVSNVASAQLALTGFSGGPGGLPGFTLCTKAGVPYDITCNLTEPEAITTCAGGGKDYCACVD